MTQEILDAKFRKGEIKRLFIGEILEGLAEVKTFPERVKALRANSERSLNTILMYTFKNEQHRITKEILDNLSYDETPIGDNDISLYPGNLHEVARRLYVFNRADLTEMKLKRLLEDILETLHPSEREILIGVFKGKLPYKNITRNLVETAFPDLFVNEVKKDTSEAQEEGKSEDSREESEKKSKNPEEDPK
jgi:hypothetical protein